LLGCCAAWLAGFALALLPFPCASTRVDKLPIAKAMNAATVSVRETEWMVVMLSLRTRRW
jgi:hypothetical protein